jgi:hypothetical protein
MDLDKLTAKARSEFLSAVQHWAGCSGSYASDARKSVLAAWEWYKLINSAAACHKYGLADAMATLLTEEDPA